jgi:DNA-binding LacI/PurR family transcriptional regulator
MIATRANISSSQRVSIVAVAQTANCSIATVSNVLNDKGRVGEEKKREVLDAIKKLGYQVNSVGRSLRLRRSEIIGLLFYPSCAQIFKNPFYAEIMEGLEEDLTSRGFHLLLAGYEVSVAESSIPKFLVQGKVDGMILMGGFPSSVIKSFDRAQSPLVLLDSNVEHPIDSVVSDGYSAEIKVVEHLYNHGHREIVMLAYSMQDFNIDLRVQGFLAGLKRFGLSEGMGQVMRDWLSHDEIYPALRERLRGPRPPTAIVTVNDTLAMALIERLQRDGIRVPNDLSIVGFDDDNVRLGGQDFLSTVRVEKKELGRVGANLIIKRIETPDAPIVKLRLPVQFVERKSVAMRHLPKT